MLLDVMLSLFYVMQDSRNCIVSIKAKPEHQIEASLDVMDIDANHGPVNDNRIPSYCNDFLKLFNGEYSFVKG
jgi:hypothetical protein